MFRIDRKNRKVKITAVTPLLIDRYLFVQVHTDAGLIGLGESGTWGYLEASEQAINTFAAYLVGQDPLRIEHHWQYHVSLEPLPRRGDHGRDQRHRHRPLGHRRQTFRRARATSCSGGKTRDKARVYYHVFGATTDELVAGLRDAKARGFTAVGHLSPFLDEPHDMPYFKTHAAKIARGHRDACASYREAVGDEVDLCIEIHRRLHPAEAIVLAPRHRALPPVLLRGPDPARQLRRDGPRRPEHPIPIATGERTPHDLRVRDAAGRGAVQYVRPDVCMAGGMTHTKKIAALAEAQPRRRGPPQPAQPGQHRRLPAAGGLHPQLRLAGIPDRRGRPPKSEIVRGAPRCEDGFLIIPDTPGIGVELAEDAMDEHPYRPRGIHTRLHVDGSVVDQ